MVARTAAEPQGRPNKFTDVGVVGRKTGLMVKDTGRRDSAGLEDMDAFFSPTTQSPRKGGPSPKTKLLSYKTKFQASLQSEDSIPMSGTSSSIRDPKEVLASRKSLLAQHRTPQKTFLKSPAVRVQTPKLSKLDSPSRVKRLLFTEIDADFDDENLNVGKDDADTFESPTETARPTAKRKGLIQQIPRIPVEPEPEPEPEEEPGEEEEEIVEEEDYHEVAPFGDDYDYEDNAFGQAEEFEEHLEEQLEEREDSREDMVMEQEEEEEEDLYGRPPTPPPVKRGKGPTKQSAKPAKKASGKGRPPKQSSTQPAAKRPRTTSAAPPSPKIIQRREIPNPADISTMDGDVRRGTRIRVAPLAHWRGERIVYELEGRRQSGPALPKIKEIVRIDTPPNPTRQHPRAQSRGPSRKRKSAESDSESDDEEDVGQVFAPVKVYGDESTIEDYRIAVSKSAINPRPLHGSKVRFEKLFQDGEYMASGIMDILVGGAKGIKPTKHSYMSFVVLSGKVEVKVHSTVFIMGKGGVFVVPRGNNYAIKNIGQKDCRLFFSQAVEVGGPPEEQSEDS